MTAHMEIPEDPNTHTLFRHPVKVGPYEAMLDIWNWEGIQGRSFIFDLKDIKPLSDETLISLIRDTQGDELTQSPPTVKRSKDHVFINFCSEQSEPRSRFDWTDRRTPEQKASARLAMDEYLKEHNRQEIERAKSAASQLSLI